MAWPKQVEEELSRVATCCHFAAARCNSDHFFHHLFSKFEVWMNMNELIMSINTRYLSWVLYRFVASCLLDPFWPSILHSCGISRGPQNTKTCDPCDLTTSPGDVFPSDCPAQIDLKCPTGTSLSGAFQIDRQSLEYVYTAGSICFYYDPIWTPGILGVLITSTSKLLIYVSLLPSLLYSLVSSVSMRGLERSWKLKKKNLFRLTSSIYSSADLPTLACEGDGSEERAGVPVQNAAGNDASHYPIC